MRGRFATLAFVVLCCVPADGQAPGGKFQITGTVHDRSGGDPLPGAEVVVRQTGHTATTDEHGAFTIDGIPGGRYDITATLPGFRTQTLQASVPQLPADSLKFLLRIGLIAETHWVPLDPSEAVRTADAIAHVRLEGLTSSRPQCADIDTIAAVHNATVISVWKGRLPANIQIFENDAGSCIEDDGSVLRLSRSAYPANTEYVVFLFGDAPPYGRLGPATDAFRVNGSMVTTKGFMDLPDTVDLRVFREQVLKMARVEIAGVVTDTEGHPLEGAEIRVENREGIAARADARGEFSITDLPPGAHVITAGLPGFRRERRAVSLPEQAKQYLKFVLRVGLIETPHYVLPSDPDAVRQSTAIALLRLDGISADSVDCDDLVVIATLHNATTLDVWKGALPRAIQVWEHGVGRCVEDDGSVVTSSQTTSAHPPRSEYVVILTGPPPRFGGLGGGSRAFRVKGSLVETNYFLGLAATVELRVFKEAVQQVLR